MSDDWSDGGTTTPTPLSPPREGRSRACYNCGKEGHMSRDCPGHGGGVGMKVNPGPSGRNVICPKTTQVLEEAADAAMELWISLKTAKSVPWRKNNRVLKMAAGVLSLLTKTRNSIRQETLLALVEGGLPNLDLEPNVDRQEREGTGDLPEQLVAAIDLSKFENIPYEITGDASAPSVETLQELKLHPLLLGNVRKCGLTNLTPTQNHASPQLLASHDVLVCSEPGSGKTTSFLLPIINQLLNHQDSLTPPGTSSATPEVLILVPTRELAVQIGDLADRYSEGSAIKTQVLFGGDKISSQKSRLLTGCDILVATTGRLKHFLKETIVDLTKVKYFILDEADRFLDKVFMSDLMEIVAKLPAKDNRISGMFCATFPNEIEAVAKEILNDHVVVSIGGACRNVQQEILEVEYTEKKKRILKVLKETEDDTKVIIFCCGMKRVRYLFELLNKWRESCAEMYTEYLESQREQELREFRAGRRQVLVCSFAIFRELDIPKVGLVVNYDLPKNIGEYLRRIGLAGGLGRVGKAVSFYDESHDADLRSSLVSTLKRAGQRVPGFLVDGSREHGEFEEGACGLDPSAEGDVGDEW